MYNIWKTILGQQFGASIDMLENDIRTCFDKLWGDRTPRRFRKAKVKLSE